MQIQEEPRNDRPRTDRWYNTVIDRVLQFVEFYIYRLFYSTDLTDSRSSKNSSNFR